MRPVVLFFIQFAAGKGNSNHQQEGNKANEKHGSAHPAGKKRADADQWQVVNLGKQS